jgi:phosphomannomutase
LDKLLISVSGVRGVVGSALTVENSARYAAAFGTYLRGRNVIVGSDTRRTGPMIKSAAVAGLLAAGCDVADAGICPTPTIEIAVRDGGYAGGIVVTASHNPDKYNALKLIGRGGLFLSESQGSKVRDLYENGPIRYVDWKKAGKLSQDNRWPEIHIRKILDLGIISPKLIKERKIAAVVDCAGGAASVMAAEFFRRLGVKAIMIHSGNSGRFPRPPEPVPENLTDLCRAVKRENADIGLAFDPDADRLAMISENGKPLGEEYTLALAAKFILSKSPGPMAVNLSSSLMNEFVASQAGVKLYRTRVGERNVTEKLMKAGGVVGGEGNGGLIYPALHWGRDGFTAAAVISQYLAESDLKISSLAGELPAYIMLKRKLNLSRRDVEKKSKAIERILPRGRVNRLDGLRVSGDGWWVQIRSSNTEPVTRLTAEAADRKTALKLINAVSSVFKKKSGGK